MRINITQFSNSEVINIIQASITSKNSNTCAVLKALIISSFKLVLSSSSLSFISVALKVPLYTMEIYFCSSGVFCVEISSSEYEVIKKAKIIKKIDRFCFILFLFNYKIS
ncbi:hypothetical protein IMCC3317_04800 [Kordia antarctica]|uniref:Uncharacterized protein n=1 Tax=Kordia antarctica TaxID=1218801 RepID=A0A7L4ZGV5_9FLAO|nr:hypothetical protein IMCC3317_04800 [Kordia antarctica]